jgi:hypothetical protein
LTRSNPIINRVVFGLYSNPPTRIAKHYHGHQPRKALETQKDKPTKAIPPLL